MEKVERGWFVSIDDTGTLDNGVVFDSSEGRRPMELQADAPVLPPLAGPLSTRSSP